MTDFVVIDRCRGCYARSERLEPVLEMEAMPLAGQFCATPTDASRAAKFPLTWLFCHHCGLVQVGEDVCDQNLFEEYNYASSTVPGLVRHFESFGRMLSERHGSNPSTKYLEIGCNDGVLLNQLPKGWQLVGVDPSDVASRAVASGADYRLCSVPFTPQLVEAEGWKATWDVVSGSNCLAHISDLRNVFEGVAMALKPGGWFWVEVHELEALLDGAQWDTIYHEHKVEWSVASLRRCVEALGFQLAVVEHLPLHGGVIRCGFQRVSDCDGKERFQRAEMPDGLVALRKAYADRRKFPAVDELMRRRAQGEMIAAYGASGRANVYLNQIPELNFSFIVDEAPLRVNRYIPAVGTPIVPRERLAAEQPAACLVTAWNYWDDIKLKNQAYYGQWLRAFPV